MSRETPPAHSSSDDAAVRPSDRSIVTTRRGLRESRRAELYFCAARLYFCCLENINCESLTDALTQPFPFRIIWNVGCATRTWAACHDLPDLRYINSLANPSLYDTYETTSFQSLAQPPPSSSFRSPACTERRDSRPPEPCLS